MFFFYFSFLKHILRRSIARHYLFKEHKDFQIKNKSLQFSAALEDFFYIRFANGCLRKALTVAASRFAQPGCISLLVQKNFNFRSNLRWESDSGLGLRPSEIKH